MKTEDKFDKVHTAIKKRFPSKPALNTIHNVLWQVIVNQNFKGRKVCFTCVVADGENQLAICEKNTPGYLPTKVSFLTPRYSTAMKYVHELNELVFRITREQSNKIVLSTMRGPTRKERMEEFFEGIEAENEDYIMQEMEKDRK